MKKKTSKLEFTCSKTVYGREKIYKSLVFLHFSLCMTHVKYVSCFKIRYTCCVPVLCCDAIKAIQKKKNVFFIITIIPHTSIAVWPRVTVIVLCRSGSYACVFVGQENFKVPNSLENRQNRLRL